MSKEKQVVFCGIVSKVVKEKYYINKRIALRLVSIFDGVPVTTATVNLPNEPLGPDEVFIKDWSENRGLYEILHVAGVVGDVIERVPAGFLMAKKVKVFI
jgi:hypothetical protein